MKGAFGRQDANHYRDIVTLHHLEGKTILGGSSYSFDKRKNSQPKIFGHSKEFGFIYPQIALDVNDALLRHKKETGINVGTNEILYIHTGWPSFPNKEIIALWKSLGYGDFPHDGTVEPTIVRADTGKVLYL